MSVKHQKHPPLMRSSIGYYHRSEWAIYGTTCDQIESIYRVISQRIFPRRITYVDADHHVQDIHSLLQIGKKQFYQSDSIHWNEYDDKIQSWKSDLIIVNGNHYPASRQIVVIDPTKKESLHRRVDQLTQIDVVVQIDGSVEIFDFLKEKLTEATVILNQDPIEGLVTWLEQHIDAATPRLKAVVLAGGKSLRMGSDKSLMDYHGVAQQLHVANICTSLGIETFISKAHDHPDESVGDIPIVKDKLVDMGPFGAIVTAQMSDPNCAWMVLPCDLPLLTEKYISKLVSSRNPTMHATAYEQPQSGFPEPLIAIYEPSIYPRMLSFLSLGYACPRKVLINSKVQLLTSDDAQLHFNANTPSEYQEAMQMLNTED